MSESHFEEMIFEFGARSAQAVTEGVRARLAEAPLRPAATPKPTSSKPAISQTAPERGLGRPRRSPEDAKCLVPACGRPTVAKKLCATHYRKAAHLKMKGVLNAAQLEVLRQDGRASRWEMVAKPSATKAKGSKGKALNAKGKGRQGTRKK